MIEIAAAIEVVKLVSGSVALIDKVYGAWTKFTSSKKIEPMADGQYSEKVAEADGNKELVHTVNGRRKKTITIQQLSQELDEIDVEHIEAMAARMTIHVRTWNSIVKNIALETNLANQAVYELKLEDLKKEIAKDLTAILTFVEQLGFQLEDHYGAARSIAGRVS